MNIIIILILAATSLLMIYLIIEAYSKYWKIKKEAYEASIKVEKEFIKVNYDNDMKPLLNAIDDAVKNAALVNLKEYFDSSNLVNGKVFNELSKNITLSVYKSLSNEYKKLLSQYLSDPQVFIYEKVYYSLMEIVISINKENIESFKM